jgi:integrase/recombinase XerD
MKQKIASSNLDKLGKELERRLIVMRYSKVATNAYMRIFGWVEDYLNGYGETDYSKELGERFLTEYQLQSIHSPPQFKNARTVIRRMDEILENKLFTPCFRKSKSECPSRFTGFRDKYLESLAKRGYREPTIKSRKMYAGRFLARLPETVLSLEELAAADLYEVFTKYEWPSVGFVTARGILSFLFESGVAKTNLSNCVPRPCRPRPLPSVYSGNEVKRLLESVDRTGSMGKRDYAILILASYLGLRSSDIVNLSFGDIDHTAKTIKIIQTKTARPLTLVMNSEAEEAIADYVRNGRPQSSSGRIFLSSQAPFQPLTAGAGYAVALKYFNLSGIAAQGRKRGTHALRASYATALVAKGVPYAVVQEALGHEDQESAKYYVRVDVRRLRTCALDVPKPTGAFAVMLEPKVRADLEGALS